MLHNVENISDMNCGS